MLTDRIGIDIWEVIDAAATKPYGFMRFEPGPGIDGHCLPVDPFYLSWRPRELDMSLGVGDIRESPALKTLTLLQGLGAELRHHDPHVPRLPARRTQCAINIST
jgi:UDP-N-acetyl-D-glucosamine dehydrogenase